MAKFVLSIDDKELKRILRCLEWEAKMDKRRSHFYPWSHYQKKRVGNLLAWMIVVSTGMDCKISTSDTKFDVPVRKISPPSKRPRCPI